LTLRRFLTRVPWWLAALWITTVAAALVNAYAGEWTNVACLAVIGLLSVYSEALHQQLTDVTADRDDLARHVDRLKARLVRRSVITAALYPRADWED
jgi:hypothetical protein